MTIVEDAQKGIITEEMKVVAKDEGLDPEFIRRGVAAGRIVIPTSPYRQVQYFTNWIEKSFSFIPISKYFSVKCLKS